MLSLVLTRNSHSNKLDSRSYSDGPCSKLLFLFLLGVARPIVQAQACPESGPFISLLNLSNRACGLQGRWTLNLTNCAVCPVGVGLHAPNL